MKLSNPWIDPRVSEVRPSAVRAYLTHRGWVALDDSEANFQEFEPPSRDDNAMIIRVPQREQGRDYPQRVIEMITDLAMTERRSAVAILDDLLATKEPSANGVPASGTTKDLPTVNDGPTPAEAR
jgi:hypothetical protein